MAKLKLPTEIRTKNEIDRIVDTQVFDNFIGSSKDAQISITNTQVASPIASQLKSPKTFPLLLSAEVHQAIVIAARRDGKSLKEFIMSAVFEKIERNSG